MTLKSPYNVILSPNSFKEWISSMEAAGIIKEGIIELCVERNIKPLPEFEIIPIGDGGEGTIDAIFNAGIGGQYITVDAIDPLGRPIQAEYLSLPGQKKTAFIEMARVAGLYLIEPSYRNPLKPTSYGVGMLIKNAFELGHEIIIVGVGGAGTHDGGVGMAQALGVEFFDQYGNKKPLYMCNESLEDVVNWELGDLASNIRDKAKIYVASDVTNPLLGENGASRVFGRQKGATTGQIEILEKNLTILSDITEPKLKTEDKGSYGNKIKWHFGNYNADTDYRHIRGSGAAGGLPYGLVAFVDANIDSGINIVLDLVNFKTRISNADLVVTGEGKLDKTTFGGKAVMGVGSSTKRVAFLEKRVGSLNVVAVCGCVGDYYEGFEEDIAKYLNGLYIASPKQLDISEVRQNGAAYLKSAAKRMFEDASNGKFTYNLK